VRKYDCIIAAEILAMFKILPEAIDKIVGGETLNRSDIVSKTGKARVVRLFIFSLFPMY